MGTISINGKTYRGNSISIVDGVVKIDGVEQGERLPSTKIELTGDVQSLQTDQSVEVKRGNVGAIKAGGSVNCNDIKGSVTAGGSVNCDDVGGNVIAGGSVNCDDVAGRIL